MDHIQVDAGNVPKSGVPVSNIFQKVRDYQPIYELGVKMTKCVFDFSVCTIIQQSCGLNHTQCLHSLWHSSPNFFQSIGIESSGSSSWRPYRKISSPFLLTCTQRTKIPIVNSLVGTFQSRSLTVIFEGRTKRMAIAAGWHQSFACNCPETPQTEVTLSFEESMSEQKTQVP